MHELCTVTAYLTRVGLQQICSECAVVHGVDKYCAFFFNYIWHIVPHCDQNLCEHCFNSLVHFKSGIACGSEASNKSGKIVTQLSKSQACF